MLTVTMPRSSPAPAVRWAAGRCRVGRGLLVAEGGQLIAGPAGGPGGQRRWPAAAGLVWTAQYAGAGSTTAAPSTGPGRRQSRQESGPPPGLHPGRLHDLRHLTQPASPAAHDAGDARHCRRECPRLEVTSVPTMVPQRHVGATCRISILVPLNLG